MRRIHISSINAWLAMDKTQWQGTPFDDGGELYCDGKAIYDLIIPEGITRIAVKAFYKYSSLKSVVLPESVSSIEQNAFNGCRGLKSIVIPDSVLHIGNDAFSGCSGLESIRIPQSMSKLEGGVFSRCSGLKSILIPESIHSIGDGTFAICLGLHDITIPDSIVFIGDRAFYACRGLESFIIPKGISRIQEGVFECCSGLKNVVIPETIASIGNRAFAECIGLESMTIPNSVTSIGNRAFQGCAHLTNITISDEVMYIGKEAFSGCSSLKHMALPKSITTIEAGTFKECGALEEIQIPDGVISIDTDAFKGCISLRSIAFPDSTKRIMTGAISECSGLKEISIPGSIEEIEKGALPTDCTYTIIVRGELGEGLIKFLPQNIALWKMVDCVDMMCNELPVYLRRQSAFRMIEKRNRGEVVSEKIWDSYQKYIRAHKKDWFASPVGENKLMIQFMIKEKLISIKEIDALVDAVAKLNEPELLNQLMAYQTEQFSEKDYAYEIEKEFRKIEKDIEIKANPDSQEYLNAMWSLGKDESFVRSFKDTRSRVVFPEKIKKATVTGIADGFKFKSDYGDPCRLIKEVSIPQGYTTIGNQAFLGCANLEKLAIPAGVSRIGYEAFCGCAGLTQISIPEGITSIEKGTFDGCTHLKEITIPNGVTSIADEAFKNCKQLRRIRLPKSIRSIEPLAFNGCEQLREVDFDGDLESWLSIEKKSSPLECGADLYIQGMKVQDVVIPNGVTNIKSYSFYGHRNLRSIEIPDSVTCIGEKAFWRCDKLLSVRIPDSVKKIGFMAFSECRNLRVIDMPGMGVDVDPGALLDSVVSAIVIRGKKAVFWDARYLFGSKGSLVYANRLGMKMNSADQPVKWLENKRIRPLEEYIPEVHMDTSIKPLGGLTFVLSGNNYRVFPEPKDYYITEYRRGKYYSEEENKWFAEYVPTKKHPKREDITAFIVQRGGNVDSKVTEKTDYVISTNIKTDEVAEAKKRGIPVLTEECFLDLFERLYMKLLPKDSQN